MLGCVGGVSNSSSNSSRRGGRQAGRRWWEGGGFCIYSPRFFFLILENCTPIFTDPILERKVREGVSEFTFSFCFSGSHFSSQGLKKSLVQFCFWCQLNGLGAI